MVATTLPRYVIRLRRQGRPKNPSYDIVVAFSDTRGLGPAVEVIGYVTFGAEDKVSYLDVERFGY